MSAKEKNKVAQRAYRERLKVHQLSLTECLHWHLAILGLPKAPSELLRWQCCGAIGSLLYWC